MPRQLVAVGLRVEGPVRLELDRVVGLVGGRHDALERGHLLGDRGQLPGLAGEAAPRAGRDDRGDPDDQCEQSACTHDSPLSVLARNLRAIPLLVGVDERLRHGRQFSRRRRQDRHDDVVAGMAAMRSFPWRSPRSRRLTPRDGLRRERGAHARLHAADHHRCMSASVNMPSGKADHKDVPGELAVLRDRSVHRRPTGHRTHPRSG